MNEYETMDWEEIVYFLFHRMTIDRVYRESPKKVVFVFEDKEECEKLSEEFLLKSSPDAVAVADTMDAIRTARKIVAKT